MARSRDIPPSGRPSPVIRLLAPAALVAATIVVILVISSSLGGDGSGSSEQRGGGGRGKGNQTTKTAKAQKPPKHYVVEPGDSLSSIADRYGVSVEAILELNPDIDPQALVTGQKLKLR